MRFDWKAQSRSNTMFLLTGTSRFPFRQLNKRCAYFPFKLVKNYFVSITEKQNWIFTWFIILHWFFILLGMFRLRNLGFLLDFRYTVPGALRRFPLWRGVRLSCRGLLKELDVMRSFLTIRKYFFKWSLCVLGLKRSVLSCVQIQASDKIKY